MENGGLTKGPKGLTGEREREREEGLSYPR